MLNTSTKGQRVQVGMYSAGVYMGSVPAQVLYFEGDGKTRGTYRLRLQNGTEGTAPAHRVNPWPSSRPFPRFRKAVQA